MNRKGKWITVNCDQYLCNKQKIILSRNLPQPLQVYMWWMCCSFLVEKQSPSTDSTPQIFIWWLLWLIASCSILTIHRFNCFLPFAVGCDLAFPQHLCEVLIDTLFKNGSYWFAQIIGFFSWRQNWHHCLRFWNLPSFLFSLMENRRVTSLQK